MGVSRLAPKGLDLEALELALVDHGLEESSNASWTTSWEVSGRPALAGVSANAMAPIQPFR
jgi:hypothetical protein